ncbi:ribonuclease J [Mesomycoplasma conjunctivae]|uniref:ribonuclease J n=1 Tax=Mesomycoplasma conjunctivae TaxID=45361 RepID=UPI003DA622B6
MAKISFFALGGQDENGKNCYVLEIDNNIFVINSGVKIPLNSGIGIDTIIPDFSYIEKNAHKVKGVFITDSKNESFSALPWLVMKVKKLPIYCSSFTKALILDRMSKYGINTKDFEIKNIAKPIEISPQIKVKAIPVAGSMPGIYGFNFETEDGVILFLTNFIIGNLGIYGNTNLDLIKKYISHPKGILALIADSGRANFPGKTIDKIFTKSFLEKTFLNASNKSRIIVGVYDEEMLSIQEIIDLATKFNRKITAYGRKYDQLYDMIVKLNDKTQTKFLAKPTFFDFKQANKEQNSVILITSTPERIYQRFIRILEKEDVFLRFKKTDHVIMLAPPINGIEQTHAKVLDEIAKVTSNLVDISESDFRVARPSRDDLAELIAKLEPKYFIPIQGLYRYLVVAGNIAHKAKIKKSNIVILQNRRAVNFIDGNLFSQKKVIKCESEVFVDGFGVGDISFEVLRERELLSRDGVLIISMLYDYSSKKILSKPTITEYGILSKENKEEINQIIDDIIVDNFASLTKISDKIIRELQEKIQKSIKRKIFRLYDKEPMVVLVVQNTHG